MADESARKSPSNGFEYCSPCMSRLTFEIVSEATETALFEVAVGDESESETRRTPEKLQSTDYPLEWPDYVGAPEGLLTLSQQRRPSSPITIPP